MSKRTPAQPGVRVRSLDGLRGIAALAVVCHHSLLTAPVLAAAYAPEPVRSAAGSVAWWLTSTPLHVLWDGTHAVFVFFVLSGLVLATPLAGGRPSRWSVYYVRRLLRLYLPVWGALAFAWLTTLLVDRHQTVGSWWLQHRASYGASGLARDAFVLDGVDALNGSLWTLRWEILFSLLLPLYIVIARRAGRARPLLAVLLLACIGLGWNVQALESLRYLPLFGLGVLMSFEAPRLATAATRLGRIRGGWPATYVLTLLLLAAYWLFFAVAFPSERIGSVLQTAAAVGACAAVWSAAHGPGLRRALETRPVQWLGVRSFSLYLVQEPIITAVALLGAVTYGPLVTLVVALPLSLLASSVFYRLVEGPSHRLSQRAGRALTQRLAPSGQLGGDAQAELTAATLEGRAAVSETTSAIAER